MNAEELRAVRTLVDALAHNCATMLTATLSEHHAKAVAVDALLRRGFSVVEGSNRAGEGRKLTLRNEGGLAQAQVPLRRPVVPAGSQKRWISPDIRIASPVELTIELQARSIHGTQAALFSGNIVDDLQRLLDRNADAFVLVADKPLYDALRGQKKEARGRKASALPIFAFVLPEIPSSDDASVVTGFSQAGVLPFAYMASGGPSLAGCERVTLALWIDESHLKPEYAEVRRLLGQTFASCGLTMR